MASQCLLHPTRHSLSASASMAFLCFFCEPSAPGVLQSRRGCRRPAPKETSDKDREFRPFDTERVSPLAAPRRGRPPEGEPKKNGPRRRGAQKQTVGFCILRLQWELAGAGVAKGPWPVCGSCPLLCGWGGGGEWAGGRGGGLRRGNSPHSKV